MCNEQKNVYAVELDMKNKSVEDIARKAAMQIIGITDALGRKRLSFGRSH